MSGQCRPHRPHGMRFEGHHGVGDEERAITQTIEVDVDMAVDLAAAGRSDDKADTVDYGMVFALVRDIVEGRSFLLLEAIAATVASAVLVQPKVESVTVRVRKLRVPIDGDLDHAGVRSPVHALYSPAECGSYSDRPRVAAQTDSMAARSVVGGSALT